MCADLFFFYFFYFIILFLSYNKISKQYTPLFGFDRRRCNYCNDQTVCMCIIRIEARCFTQPLCTHQTMTNFPRVPGIPRVKILSMYSLCTKSYHFHAAKRKSTNHGSAFNRLADDRKVMDG